MITKIPPSVSYNRFLYFSSFTCAGQKLQMEGPGKERPQGSIVCQLLWGQGQGTHPTPAIGLMCDLGQTTYSLWSLPFTVCLSKLV